MGFYTYRKQLPRSWRGRPTAGRPARRVFRAAGRIAAPAVMVAAAGGWLAGPSGIAEAATTTSFTVPTCTTQDWTVPAGVTAAVFDVYGAVGGQFRTPTLYTAGGAGGYVHAALAVSAGQVLTIAAGGEGGSGSQFGGPGSPASPGAGGCGGGGAGGAVQGPSNGGILALPGAGGGGASQVSVSGAAAPALVAAGGGGASFLGSGGQGGPQTGGSGTVDAAGARAATGGSQSAGGQPGIDAAGGILTADGATGGNAGTGGTGGSLLGNIVGQGGGGGGGGWYGGGGGAIGSGAGGSNYIAPGSYDAVSDGGANSGQGSVTVTYGTADFPAFTGSPPNGVAGQAYSYQFQSPSWPAPQYFTNSPAALPPGLTVSAGGTLSGTPTTPGSYTFNVDAANPAGASGQQITMTIDATPQITTQPAGQSVTAGQPVTFTAAASGYPAPTVQWQVSSHGSTTWSNLAGATTASLSFTAASGDNGNSYRAVFTNNAGSTTTMPASLVVTTPTLSATPAAGPAGTKVTLSGKGWQPAATVTLRLGSATGKLLATSTATATGTISVTLRFPAATYGPHTVDAVAGGVVAAKTTFTIQAHLAISPKTIAPGKTAKANLTGFKARQPVTLRLASATGRKLATLTTGTTGSGTATITIPATTKAGTYKVYAIGSGSRPTTTTTITVS